LALMADAALATFPALPLVWDGTSYTGTLPASSPLFISGSTTIVARATSAGTAGGQWIGGYAPPNTSSDPPPRFQLTDAMIVDHFKVVKDSGGSPGTTVLLDGPAPIPVPAFDVGFVYIARSITGDPTIQYAVSPNNNSGGPIWIVEWTVVITPPPSTTGVSTGTAAAGKARCLAQEQASALSLEWLRQERIQTSMDYNNLGLLAAVTNTRLGLAGRELLLTRIKHDLVAEGDPPEQRWDTTYTLDSFPGFDAIGASLYGRLDEMRLDSGRLAP
jgi:hypothetical protein